MNAETLHDALTLLPDDLIDETDALRRAQKPKIIPWKRILPIAACLSLILLTAPTMLALMAPKGAKEMAMDYAAPAETAPAPAAAPQTEKALLESPAEAAPGNGANERGAVFDEAPSITDCTGQFENAFNLDGMTVSHPAGSDAGSSASFSKTYPDFASLETDAANIVVGTVTDIAYTDDNAVPRTISTFLISETWKGDISPDSLISVGESGGYVRMATFIEVYGNDHFPDLREEEIESTVYAHSICGAPMTQVGDQYVLFLSEEKAEGRLAGAYGVIGGFMGKYIFHEETAFYARFCPADLDYTEQPMTLAELRDLAARYSAG